MTVSLNKLAKTVDEFYTVKKARLAKDKEAAALKKRENELKAFLIENISKSDAMGVVGKTMRATIVTKSEPTPENWDLLYKYILKKKEFDLLQRRLSTTAVKERWENKVDIPGVGKIQIVDISLTKIS